MRRKHNHFTVYCPRFRSKILHNSSSKLAKLHCFHLSDLEIFVSANHNWQQYFAIFEFKFKYANIIFSVQPIDHPKFLHSVFPLCPRVRWKNSAEKHFQNCLVLLSPVQLQSEFFRSWTVTSSCWFWFTNWGCLLPVISSKLIPLSFKRFKLNISYYVWIFAKSKLKIWLLVKFHPN